MKNKFKLLVLKFIKFVLIFLLVDCSLGYVANQLYFNQKTGKQARITNSIEKASHDIFVFGSSHAVRHYVPEIIEKKLNKTCYNAGVRGQGILFNNTLQQLVLKRSTPDLIILNVDYDWLSVNHDFYDRLVDLHPYYWEHRKVIKPVLDLKSKPVDLKLFFRAYQMNSTLAHIIKYAVSPQNDYNGYLPEVTELKVLKNKTNFKIESKSQSLTPLDKNFISAYTSFLTIAKKNKIDLLIIISPSLQNIDASKNISLKKLKSIATVESINVIDLMKDKRFINNQNLFRDRSHLNEDGARLFSKIVADTVKTSFQ